MVILVLVILPSVYLFSQSTFDNKINALITPLSETNNYAGNVLVSKEGEVIYSQSFGKNDYLKGIDHNFSSKFFLCSGSMIFTSTAIMKLVDEGKLSLDDPLSKFIPEIKRSDEITIHHMLAQRSGIPGIGTVGGLSRAFLLNYQKQPHTPKELVDYIIDYDLLYDPGTNYNHGKSEYNILAYVIEKVSGLSFGEYLNKSIFHPLGMYNSGHYGPDVKEPENLSIGHAHEGFKELKYADKIHWSSKTGHASIYSTVEDLNKFGYAILNKELLSEASWKIAFTDYGENWGYGGSISLQQGHKRIQINGRSPGFSSYFGIYPSENLVVVMLSNIYISLPYFVGPGIASIVLEEDYEQLNLSTAPISEEYGKTISGTYKFKEFYRPGGKVRVSYNNGILYSDGSALIPAMVNDKVDKFLHRHYWSSLRFIENSEGEYDKLHFDDYEGIRDNALFAGISIFQKFIIGFFVLIIVTFGIRFLLINLKNKVKALA